MDFDTREDRMRIWVRIMFVSIPFANGVGGGKVFGTVFKFVSLFVVC